ncbi:MAG: PEP-CTERM sorting domain-containing protein [Deltaproteobacteria bacterium]|nr:PEP-CTERM sorting domain-containing protein [Deltaproteobacteria bacterium]
MLLRTIVSVTLASAIACFAGSAAAVAIAPTLLSDPGVTLNTTGISTYTTGGDDMAGMVVTAYFDDATSESGVWTVTGTDAGAASGTGWSLSLNDSTTWTGVWTLDLSSLGSVMITGLEINGRPGDTVFDILGPDPDQLGTPGSDQGKPISSVDGPSGLSVTATYRNEVELNSVYYGDLYTILDLEFGGTVGGLVQGDAFSFIADSDNSMAAIVPEPSTGLLLGLGLVMLAGRRTRARG